jgi:hypothetical protein
MPGRHFTNARALHPHWLFLVHFLSGADGSAWGRIEAAARSLDFGLGSALAPRPSLCHLGAVLCDIISNDGARRTMQDALTGRCLGRQPEEDGQNKQQTKTHPGVFLLQIDRGEKSLTARRGLSPTMQPERQDSVKHIKPGSYAGCRLLRFLNDGQKCLQPLDQAFRVNR